MTYIVSWSAWYGDVLPAWLTHPGNICKSCMLMMWLNARGSYTGSRVLGFIQYSGSSHSSMATISYFRSRMSGLLSDRRSPLCNFPTIFLNRRANHSGHCYTDWLTHTGNIFKSRAFGYILDITHSEHAWMVRFLFLRRCQDACGRGLSICIRGKYDMGNEVKSQFGLS